MKNRAEVVIIGGGVIGCSIAYNLARAGVKDVIVLEKDYLASGSTGRCGAGIRQQWGTKMNCLLAQKSLEIYENFNEILGVDLDIQLKQGGYLLLAYSEREMEQFNKNLALQKSLGIPSKRVSVAEAQEIVPFLNTQGIVGGTFCPTDGHANPFRVTQAYAEAARRLGVEIYTGNQALDIQVEGGKVKAVLSKRGLISTRKVVNAAGGYSQKVAQMVGLNIPTRSERHEILVTEKVEPLLGPMVMSFSYNIYCQQTPDGSLIMGYGDPEEPESYNLHSSWQFLEEMARKATKLLPLLRHLRVVRQWAGLYNKTPDRQPIIDESSEIEGFYLAVGFSGHGFMIAPMVGKLMAEMITGQALSLDLKLDLERFQRGDLILEPAVV